MSRNKSLCLNCFCDLEIDLCPQSQVIMLGGVLNNGHLYSDFDPEFDMTKIRLHDNSQVTAAVAKKKFGQHLEIQWKSS